MVIEELDLKDAKGVVTPGIKDGVSLEILIIVVISLEIIIISSFSLISYDRVLVT